MIPLEKSAVIRTVYQPMLNRTGTGWSLQRNLYQVKEHHYRQPKIEYRPSSDPEHDEGSNTCERNGRSNRDKASRKLRAGTDPT